MFKYTPPWQVLCNSLDHNFKRQAKTVTVNPNVASTQEQAALSFHSTLRPSLPRSALNHPPSRVPMTSNPKRWVIKPFSPKLQHLDLRSILSPTDQPQSLEKTWSSSQDGDSFMFSLESTMVTAMQPTVMVSSGSGKSTPDVMVQARQVAVSEDGSDSENWRPSTPSNPSSPNSSTGSHVGFYSFVDDPACPEAVLNEVYMVSPKRQAKLNTLKEKSTFKLQTYAEGKRPARLFEETNGDDRYQMEDTFAVNENEENPNRIEIIRNQAPKKSPALKEQWSALENLDLSNNPQRLLDGFSLLYKPVSANTEQARVEPGTIDNEQIDFNTARKQFLLMEQSKQNLQHLPYSPKMRGRITSSTASIFTPKDTSRKNSLEENQIALAIQKKTEINNVTEDREDEVRSGDVDSGLGERSGGYTSDGSITNDPAISEVESSLTLLSAEETPIQREIRISREREEDLRRSRGILRTDTLEMVEIRTKPILSQSSSQIKAAKAKESNRVSFFIQRELELEKQRQFTVPYHNSENQALDKKASFESHPQEIPNINLKPSQQESPTNDLEQKTVSADDMWITEQPVLVEEGDLSGTKEVLSPCCPHRHPDESMLQRNTDCSMSGNKDQTGAYSEGNNYSKVKVYFENGVDSQTSNLGTLKNSSWIVETDKSMSRRNRLYSPTILSQLDPEKTSWYTPAWRSHSESTEWSPKLQNAPNSIRQEIEEDLRREQELQELRESLSEPIPLVTLVKTFSEPRSPVTSNEDNVFSPETSHEHMKEVDSVPPEKKTDHSYPYSWSLATSSVSRLSMTDKSPQLFSPQQNSRLPSMSIMIPQPWGNPKPMSPSVSRVTPIKPLSTSTDLSSPISQKGLTETLLKDFEDRRVKLKLEESAYAGIQPTDAINNEVVEATRVTRHKNQRALQWEAGMYANQDS